MTLEIFWFCLIAVFWGGYFVLEGFDFGVGILLPFLPRNAKEREAMLETIGPFWDGNEVWLVVAAGATFAAFPAWYATMFSGFYIALLLVLVLLIVRAVSFEWRTKSESSRWRGTWLTANVVGSIGVPFIWAVALSSLVHGVPLSSSGDYAGDFWDLFTAYTVFAGIVTVLLFALHGAAFLTLSTSGDLRERAAATARRLALPVGVVVAALLTWTVAVAVDRNEKDVFPPVVPAALGILAIIGAALFAIRRRSGWAFIMSAVATLLLVATIFTGLYPRVLVSSPDFGNSLTIANAASSHYALQVMTIAALIITPVVLLYQGWTYHVLRGRIGGEELTGPVDLAARKTGA